MLFDTIVIYEKVRTKQVSAVVTLQQVIGQRKHTDNDTGKRITTLNGKILN